MVTIAPRPAATIAGPNACSAKNVPARLTSRVRRKSSPGTSSIEYVTGSSEGGWSMPALATSTRGAPGNSAATRSSAARSVTSARASSNRPPTSARSSSAPASETSTPTTSAPAEASVRTQTGPSCPRAPVTTASSPASAGSVAIRPGAGRHALRDLRLEQLERQRAVGGQRMAQRAPDHAIELVGRQPVAGGLGHDVLLAQHVPGRQLAARDQLLAHLRRRLDLRLVHAL